MPWPRFRVLSSRCRRSRSARPGNWPGPCDRGRVSSLELLRAYLDRVDRLNPAINAIVVDDRERALKDARAADRALAKGARVGPLHGVPMTVKESFNIPGTPTTWGFPEFAGNVASEDAVAVARLRAAGAVIFGKTNVPMALADFQSYNDVYGTTNNPWDLTQRRRRFLGRLGCRAGGGPDRARVRQRHRRQHPQPGRVQRRVRAQADLRHRAQTRSDAERSVGQRGPDLGGRPAGPLRRRPRPRPQGHRRPRPRGRLPAGAAGAAADRWPG